jgi:hypothetical protein
MNSVLMIAIFAMAAGAAPQWRHTMSGVPRLPNGKVDLTAPAPRRTDGKPDITGLWKVNGGYVADIAKDLKPGDVPYQTWAQTLYNERRKNNSKDDPTASCIIGGIPRSDVVPYPFKIVESPGMTVILYEAVHSYRQIFTDGRPLPQNDPTPTWFGYSVGKWDGDTFVVETSNVKDGGWIDNNGKPSTDALHVTERFHRKDFGHLDLQITIDDPKAYTTPWSVLVPFTFQADDELMEYICEENNKYFGNQIKQ